MAISPHEQAAVDDLANFFAVYGEDITYTPDVGDEESIQAVVEPDRASTLDLVDGTHTDRPVTFHIRQDIITTQPTTGTVTWLTRKYAYRNSTNTQGGMWTIEARRVNPEEKHSSGHFRKV